MMAQQLQLEELPVDVSIDVTQSDGDPVTFSKEQLMHIRGNISKHLPERLQNELSKQGTSKYHIVLVVDQSGSMSGTPFNQVKIALQDIVGQCISDEKRVLDVILYQHNAATVSFTPQNYTKKIDALQATGGTNFKAAFEETKRVITKRQCEHCRETIILFLTDGHDTSNNQDIVQAAFKQWKQYLNQQQKTVVVHAIGFSQGHDLAFLKKISTAGTTEGGGLYRYCEPGDGPKALKNKLEELFEHISTRGGHPVKFRITFNNSHGKLMSRDSNVDNIDGVIDFQDTEEGTDLTLSSDCWIMMDDPSKMPTMSIEMHLKMKKIIKIPCKIANCDQVIITDIPGKALWDMAILMRNADDITAEFSEALTAGKDVLELKEKLDLLQKKVSETTIFKRSFNKDVRHQLMESIKIVQTKIDKLHGIVATYIRGECQGVSLLAKAHDLRYDAQFTKSRRQRLMNRRVAQNFKDAKAQSQKASVAVEEEVANLSEATLDFYTCILSMYSVKDLLLDDTDLENALGIGLSVSRPEHVLDNPTSIRVINISGSLVSRSFLMEALQYKINTDGPLAAHGGFSFESIWDTDVSYITVDAGREPINAWLPLYVTSAHWQRVKTILKSSLGYFCTLDPLGFAENQLDILFMVLGCMIGQLTSKFLGENQLKLIFALQITCAACMKEFKLKKKILNQVTAFLDGPQGRFKNEIPNMNTMIGYIACLPNSVTRPLLQKSYDDKTETQGGNQFWVAMITEQIRRASALVESFHKNGSTATGLLNMLLHSGDDKGENKLSCTDDKTVHHFGQLCWKFAFTNEEQMNLTISDYNPHDGITVPELKVKQVDQVDKAMAVWAEAFCGTIKKKNHAEKISNAEKLVKKWVRKLYEDVGLPEKVVDRITSCSGTEPSQPGPSKVTEAPPCKQAAGAANTTPDFRLKTEAEEKASQFNTNLITPSVLDVLSKVTAELSKRCFPYLSSLPGCIGFLRYWTQSGNTFEDLDKNGGIPPEQWISEAKKSVREVYAEMEDFKKKCESFSKQETEGERGAKGGSDDKVEDAIPQHAAAGNDAIDSEEDYDSYDEEQWLHDDVTLNLRKTVKSRMQTITLPMLLTALGLHSDQLQLIWAMACQAISYPVNSQAREATEQRKLLDLCRQGNSSDYICSIEAELILQQDVLMQKMKEKVIWKLCNKFMLKTDNIWTFIGYLLNTHQERDEGFSDLMDCISNCSDAGRIPLLTEKLKILLCGKYDGHQVFAKGNNWMPKKNKLTSLQALVGEEAWTDIERELMSNVQIHVYRSSDLPNRHGHCNSNPYIPNSLRKILGMELIDEKIQPRTSTKRHKHPK